MPLYRVVIRSRSGQCSYDNTVVADSIVDAIDQRKAALGIEPDDDYDAIADAVPDPDGSKAARWLALWDPL